MQVLPISNNQYNTKFGLASSSATKQTPSVLTKRLEHQLLRELTPQSGPKIISRLKRLLDTNGVKAKSINFVNDGAIVTFARKGTNEVIHVPADTTSRVDVIHDMLNSWSGESILESNTY